MQNQLININGKDYALKFGYGAFRVLGTLWNVPGPAQVGEKIATAFKGIDEKNGTSFTFDQMNVIGEMVLSAIIASDINAQKEITADDVGTEVLRNPENVVIIIETYMASISGIVATKGKPKPRKKTRQKVK